MPLKIISAVITLAAMFLQTGITGKGLAAVEMLSLIRIVLIIGICGMEVLFWAFLPRRLPAWLPNLLLALAAAAAVLTAAAYLQVDSLPYLRAAAFVKQAVPFLAAFTGLAILFVIGKAEKGFFRDGRVVWQAVLIFLACLLLMGAYIPLRDNYYPSHDHAIFSYIGQQILKGRVPYSELWDHKPPLIFYIDALGLKLAGGSLIGIWLTEFVCLFIGALLFFRVLKNRFSEGLSLCVTVLGLLHYVRLFDFGNYTEEFSLFFVLCALAWTAGGEKRGGTFLSGLLCGLAFTCKQNTIGFWCALVLPDLFRMKDFGKLLRKYLPFLCGFLTVNALWVVYFAAKGALGAYWDVAFRFNFLYAEKSGASRLATARTTLTFLPLLTPFLFAAFCCWPLFCFYRKADDPLTALALIWLPLELICAGLSGMNYQHYFILCIPPACVLLCAGLCLLTEKVRIPAALPPVVLCFCCLPLLRLYRENYAPRYPSAYTMARDYLLENTEPDDPVLVWGSRSALYVMAERSAPTAYFNERPLYLFADDSAAEKWEELLNDLSADPPAVVIWTHDSALPFVSFASGSCTPPDSIPMKQEVYRFFCENYSYDTTLNEGNNDAWECFRLKPDAVRE